MSFGMYEEAILEVLLIRTPSGPPIRIEEIFLDVSMNDLDFLEEEIQNHEPTVVEAVDERPIDLMRLYDTNDDYEELLFDPNRVIEVRD
jgi:hypothetical protein